MNSFYYKEMRRVELKYCSSMRISEKELPVIKLFINNQIKASQNRLKELRKKYYESN